MNYEKSSSTFKSSNKMTDITYFIYEPLDTIKGILQISHGMCEYTERYEEFIDFMTGKGILVCGNDHLGHGTSIKSNDELGYFSETEGWSILINDMKYLTDLIAKQYPKNPIFILGHSMGSFLLKVYISQFGTEINGAIISGSSGKNPIAGFGELLISFIHARKGDFYRSERFNKLFFNGFNGYFKNESSKFAWLTSEKTIVENYEKDPKCNFIFTTNGFMNLIKVQRISSAASWALTVPKALPLLFISGELDPVGAYGKGVKSTYKQLEKADVKDVTIKLYKEGRHEMLNEINRYDVYKDILAWIVRKS